jgi:hypothetical protein
MSEAPSPENYTLGRDLAKPQWTVPRAAPRAKSGKDTVGPGRYEVGGEPLYKKSFNAGVPRPVSALAA